jgi:4-amino-4-deoxy-L-arabinose transferase-like glycosyltransferase
VFIVFATVWEVLFLYKLNKSEKWKNFLSRYLSIGLVAFVRSLLFIALPLIILLILTVAILDPAYNEMNTWIVDVVFVVVYYVWYIFLQAQSFKRVNA